MQQYTYTTHNTRTQLKTEYCQKLAKQRAQQLGEAWNKVMDMRAVMVPHTFLHVMPSLKAAILMAQLCYWYRFTDVDDVGPYVSEKFRQYRKEGWLFKRMGDLTLETRLTTRELETARAQLREMGLIEEKIEGKPRVILIRLCVDNFNQAINNWNRNFDTNAQWVDVQVENIPKVDASEELKNRTFRTLCTPKARLYHRDLALLTGDATSAFMLSMMMDECIVDIRQDPSIAYKLNKVSIVSKRIVQWERTIGLKRTAQYSAREKLKKVNAIKEMHLISSRRIFTLINSGLIKEFAIASIKLEDDELRALGERHLTFLEKLNGVDPKSPRPNPVMTQLIPTKQGQKTALAASQPDFLFPHKLHSDSANPAFRSRKSCNSYITTNTNTKTTKTTTHATSKISTAEEIAGCGLFWNQNKDDDVFKNNAYPVLQQLASIEEQQMMLDELSCNKAVQQPIPYLKALVKAKINGTFTLSTAAKNLKEARDKQKWVKAMLAENDKQHQAQLMQTPHAKPDAEPVQTMQNDAQLHHEVHHEARMQALYAQLGKRRPDTPSQTQI